MTWKKMVAPFVPFGAHTVETSLSSAFEPTIPNGATKVLVQALNRNLRMTLDGTTPTASIGFEIVSGDPPFMVGITQGTVLKFIEEASGGILQYQFGE